MKLRAKTVVQKLRHEAKQPQWRKSKNIRWIIGVVLTLVIAGLFPRTHTLAISGYSVGSLWTSEDVIAPFSFPVYKDNTRYRQDLNKALEELYPVYTADSSARNVSIDSLRRVWGSIVRYAELSQEDSLDDLSVRDSVKHFDLSKDEWETVWKPERRSRSAHKAVLLELEPQLVKILSDIETSMLIAKSMHEDAVTSGARSISLATNATEEVILSRDTLLSVEAASNRIFAQLEARIKKNPQFVKALGKIVSACIVPNVIYNAERTDESRLALENRVPRTDGIVIEGQRIVGKGDLVTPTVKGALESLSQARLDRGGAIAQAGRIIGTIGHAAIIMLLLVLYLKFIRRRIYNDNAQLLVMGLTLLFPAVLAFLSVRIQAPFPLEYLILLPVTSMLLTILFDSRTGFYGTVISALIVAGIRGNDYAVALAGLTAGAFAAYTVRDLRSRSQLFQSIGYVFLGYFVAVTALSLEKGTPFGEMGFQLLASLANALISPVLTFGVLYLVESIFDTVSDLRLTEFDNINHPLMRELAMRAPGTYQHTMLVAQLAENAAIAIGANALLAKVGAFFHDIGKLTEPMDFIENQAADARNVHETIPPVESAERIRNHVIQGIDLGRAHHLPEQIIDFIPMHHGTMRISFFYDRAVQASATGGIIDETLFRYPGPKPRTKETAIVMLADASEAIARSVAASSLEPTLEAIQEALEKLIRARFADGQLDDCDLTMRDLSIVTSVFARLLVGLHHTRINYPTPAPLPAKQEAARAKRDKAAAKA